MLTVEAYAGYCKALTDVAAFLERVEPNFKSLRHNNIRHIVWLLQGLLRDADLFMRYGRDTPVSFRVDGKRVTYYVDRDDWPVSAGRHP